MLFNYNQSRFDDLKKRNFPNRKETMFSYIERRERVFYQKFFLTYGIKLMGDPEKPAMILNDNYLLSGYLNGFTLILFDKADGDQKQIYSFRLDSSDFNETEFINAIESATHHSVYTLGLIENNLYLAGRNFEDRLNYTKLYPVFSSVNPIIFLKKTYAAKELANFEDYELEILELDTQSVDLNKIDISNLILDNNIFFNKDIILIPEYTDDINLIDIQTDIKNNNYKLIVVSDYKIVIRTDKKDYWCFVTHNDRHKEYKIKFSELKINH